MKYWRSQDRKRVLDLTKIIYWQFLTKEDANEENNKYRKSCHSESCGKIMYPDINYNELRIYVGGSYPLIFRGEEADEIYNILQSQKEVL